MPRKRAKQRIGKIYAVCFRDSFPTFDNRSVGACSAAVDRSENPCQRRPLRISGGAYDNNAVIGNMLRRLNAVYSCKGIQPSPYLIKNGAVNGMCGIVICRSRPGRPGKEMTDAKGRGAENQKIASHGASRLQPLIDDRS